MPDLMVTLDEIARMKTDYLSLKKELTASKSEAEELRRELGKLDDLRNAVSTAEKKLQFEAEGRRAAEALLYQAEKQIEALNAAVASATRKGEAAVKNFHEATGKLASAHERTVAAEEAAKVAGDQLRRCNSEVQRLTPLAEVANAMANALKALNI